MYFRRGGKSVAAPRQSCKLLGVEAGQQRVIRHAWEHLPQPVLRHAEAETLLENLRSLLEHDHLQPVAHPRYVRPRAVGRQRLLADNQHVVTGQVRVRIHRLEPDLQAGQQLGRLALGIEQRDLRQ